MDFELSPKMLVLIPVALIILALVISAIAIVPAGFKGILLQWGAAQDLSLDQGLHFIVPIADSVQQMDIRTQKYEAKAEAATADLLDVTTDVAVNYHIDPSKAVVIYKTLGLNYQDNIIQPAVQEVVKATTADFTAPQLITDRADVKQKIDDALQIRLAERGIILETTSITDFTFPQSFNDAITNAQTSKQNVIKAQNDLLRIQVEAQQAIAAANGTAQATLIQATANAQSIEIRGTALKNNPQVSTLEWINKWNGQLPNYMFGGTTGAVPFINVPTTTGG